MPTIRKLLKSATSYLEGAEIESARLDARVLLEYVLDCGHSYIVINSRQLVAKPKVKYYEELLRRRRAREPISSIIGKREFWSIDFKTSGKTLDPRPDSETLIEAVMKQRSDRAKSYKIVDFGTGTGCLLLSLMSEYPNASGVAVDVSDHALEIAKHNADEIGLSKRVEFVQSNWGEVFLQDKSRHCEEEDPTRQSSDNHSGLLRYARNDGNILQADIIITNPPYIPTSQINKLAIEVKDYDPHLALDGGADGLDDYRKLAPQIAQFLVDDGLLVVEFGEEQHEDVREIFQSAGLKFIKFEKDLAGIVRCAVFCA